MARIVTGLTSTKKIIPTERQEQKMLVKWVKQHSVIKKFLIKIGNEGKRTPAQGFHEKLMGLCVGASDLFLAYPNCSRTKAGLWIEVKRNMHYPPSARKSKSWVAEEAFIEDMKSVGFDGKFCYGWEEGRETIETYLRS